MLESSKAPVLLESFVDILLPALCCEAPVIAVLYETCPGCSLPWRNLCTKPPLVTKALLVQLDVEPDVTICLCLLPDHLNSTFPIQLCTVVMLSQHNRPPRHDSISPRQLQHHMGVMASQLLMVGAE
jgi:hypothetical protein